MTGELLNVFHNLVSVPSLTLTPSPHGSGSLLTAFSEHDGRITIWDPSTGELIAGPLMNYRSIPIIVRFTLDGARLVSAAYNGTVRVWDVIRLLKLAASESKAQGQGQNKDDTHATLSERDSGKVFRDTSHPDSTGWIKGPNSDSELLIWIPPIHRAGLWTPSSVMTIAPVSTKLDFSRFAGGELWTECYGDKDQ
jgi:WD40 repeat protein